MFVYDADTPVDAETWRSLGEGLAVVVVAEYHRRCKPHPRAGNQRLHNLIHVVVENQVAMGDETPAAAKLEELIAEGLSRHDAIHAIGSVFVDTLHGIATGSEVTTFDSDGRYGERVKALTAQSWLDGFADDPAELDEEDEDLMFDLEEEDGDLEDFLGEEEILERDSTDSAPVRRSMRKVGRNDPCPCGSGKKHKKCCGK